MEQKQRGNVGRFRKLVEVARHQQTFAHRRYSHRGSQDSKSKKMNLDKGSIRKGREERKEKKNKDANKNTEKKEEDGWFDVTALREKDEWPSLKGAILIYIAFSLS